MMLYLKIFNFLDKNHKEYNCWLESEPKKSQSQITGQHDEIIKQIVMNRKKSCYYFVRI